MKATVDHRARKQVIIANAIQLFARQGYNDVTFQDLADSSGIARTILYRYFKNKRQVFDAAIFLALDRVVQKHAEIMRAKLPASVRLRQICTALVGGIHYGEFRADVNPDVYTDLLYAQFESAVLRLTVSGDATMTDVVNRIDEILRGLERK